jgi:ribosomal-protein-alanine N-acetyltransferase
VEDIYTPRLETERLILRPLTEGDLGFIFSLFSDPETNKYSSSEDLATPEDAQRMYEGYLKPGFPSHFRLAAELKETGEAVGTLGLYMYSERYRSVVLGYDLLKAHWGHGYMAEAVGALLCYGFGELGLNRVEATVDPLNLRSVRLLEMLGFTLERCMRERYLYKGGAHDELIYGYLKKDWGL